jgi:hypothetical protein
MAMKKPVKPLSLNRETLQALDRHELRAADGKVKINTSTGGCSYIQLAAACCP